MFTVGFNSPAELDFKDWRQRYGCSKGVPKNESLTINIDKSVSIGRVKSYGSITSIVNDCA
jgi:hypothetical protein